MRHQDTKNRPIWPRIRAIVPICATAALFVPFAVSLAHLLIASPESIGRVWGDTLTWDLLGKSLLYSATGATIVVACGFVSAARLLTAPPGLALVLLVLSAVPMLLPSTVFATGWIIAFGRAGAVWNIAGIEPPPFTVFDYWVGAMLTSSRWFVIPAGIFLLAGRRAVGTRDAEQLLVSSRVARTTLFSIPRTIRPAMLSWLAVMLLTFADPVTPALFLTPTISEEVVVFSTALLDPLAAIAVATVPSTLGALAVVGFALAVHGPIRSLLARDQSKSLVAMTSKVRVTHAFGVLCPLVLAGVPLIAIVRSSASLLDAVTDNTPEIWNTFLLAALTAPAVVTLGSVIAQHILNNASSRRVSLVLAAASLLAISPGVVGLCVSYSLRVLGAGGLRDSLGPLVCALTIQQVPLVMLVLAATWSKATPNIEVVRVMPVGLWTRFRYLEFPMRIAGLGLAMALSLILTLTEVSSSLILAPAGFTTLGVRIHSMIHTAPHEETAALACIATGGSLCLLVAGLFALRPLIVRRPTR